MYQWELCWCLRDTDPEPEYQEHWHYEGPGGNKRELVDSSSIKSIEETLFTKTKRRIENVC